MIRHITVDIRRNEGATIRNSFPEWEIPILKVVHGEDSVTQARDANGTALVKLVDRQLPDAHDEFVRLQNRYKRSRDDSGAQSTPYINMVYGEMGVQKLADAIQRTWAEPLPGVDLVGELEEEQVSSVGG